MTKLVTGAEFAEIREAINDVVDTFHNFSITYCQHGIAFDRWSEENQGAVTKTVLRCFYEYDQEDEDSQTKLKTTGASDIQEIEVSFGVDYLDSVNMLDPITKEAVFNRATDYFELDSVVYRIRSMVADGPIDNKMALIVVTLIKEEKNAK